MTWLFGALTISSAFIFVGWGRAWLRNWSPLTIRNVPMLVALGMVTHSVALFGFTGIRTVDLIAGYNFDGSSQTLLMGALLLLLVSKVSLVWAAALWRRDRDVGLSWWLYLATMAAWSLYIGVRG